MIDHTLKRKTSSELLMDLLLLTVIFVAVFYFAWVGYLGTDDGVYIENARRRMIDPLFVGRDHWEVRLTLTWAMALIFKLWGQSEISAALATLLYAFFTGLGAYLFFRRREGRVSAILVAILIATSPLLAINATSLRIDSVETFFVMASLFACLLAFENRKPTVLLLVAGILAGLAILTRPTAIALGAFYGILFIIQWRIKLQQYLLIAAGFLSIWLAESIYYAVRTGNFFYRFSVDFNHDKVLRSTNLFEAVVVAPVKMLLFSHNLGLVFWCLPFAALYLIRTNPHGSEARSRAIFFTLFAGVWIAVFSGFASKLVLDPRYLAPAAVSGLILVALASGQLIKHKKILPAAILVTAFIATHLLAIYMENKDFAYAERWLVKLAKTSQEKVYTDPQTFQRAKFLLEVENIKQNVIAEPAPSGGLFLSVPENAARGNYNSIYWTPSEYVVTDWPVVEKLDPGRKLLGEFLESIGLANKISPALWKKLNNPNPPITLYRRP